MLLEVEGGAGSVYSGTDAGARGLLLVLKSEGIRAAPLMHAANRATETGLLVILDPPDVPEDECAAVTAWLERGGSLLLTFKTENRLTRHLGLRVDAGTTAEIGLATPADDAQKRIASGLATAGDASVHGVTVLFAKNGRPQAITQYGGAMVAVSDTFSASNAGLDGADNVFFYLATVKRLAAGRPVWFLETVHGFAREPGMVEYAAGAGWGALLVQIAVVVLVACWAFGARTAPPVPASTLLRRAAAEYAATIAHLYRRGDGRRHAVRVALQELKRWHESAAFARAARKAPPDFEKRTDALIAAGESLAQAARPVEAEAFAWIAKAAALRKGSGHGS